MCNSRLQIHKLPEDHSLDAAEFCTIITCTTHGMNGYPARDFFGKLALTRTLDLILLGGTLPGRGYLAHPTRNSHPKHPSNVLNVTVYYDEH